MSNNNSWKIAHWVLNISLLNKEKTSKYIFNLDTNLPCTPSANVIDLWPY